MSALVYRDLPNLTMTRPRSAGYFVSGEPVIY